MICPVWTPEQWLESEERELQLEEQEILADLFAAACMFEVLDQRVIDLTLGMSTRSE